MGTEIEHPNDPLIDEDDASRFMKVTSSSKSRLIHIYVLEITPADARARQQEDQIEFFKKIGESKSSSSVVIEEIEEPDWGYRNRLGRRQRLFHKHLQRLFPKHLC